jgi:hypothetical protein
LVIHAAYHGHLEVVELLLECLADVEATDRFNKSAMDYAVERGHTAVEAVLQDIGAFQTAATVVFKRARAASTAAAAAAAAAADSGPGPGSGLDSGSGSDNECIGDKAFSADLTTRAGLRRRKLGTSAMGDDVADEPAAVSQTREKFRNMSTRAAASTKQARDAKRDAKAALGQAPEAKKGASGIGYVRADGTRFRFDEFRTDGSVLALGARLKSKLRAMGGGTLRQWTDGVTDREGECYE